MDRLLEQKRDALESILRAMGGCVIGFSGGVDSTLLYAVARRVIGDRVVAVTVSSEIHPGWEREEATELARLIGGTHRIISLKALDIPGLADNPDNRCYLCKSVIATELRKVADEAGLLTIVDGSNSDDLGDYRPGRQAAREAGIRSPLEEAGLGKDEIRALSRAMNLPTWDKPSCACLISRFPYGVSLTTEKLGKVAAAETFLRGLGLRTVRVRYHDDVARLELGPEESLKAIELRESVTAGVRQAGFAYVALDLEGYRTGAMNESLGTGRRMPDES